MASAIYRLDPTKPPSRGTASNAKLSKDALDLAEKWERSDVLSALGIVSMLYQEGYVDDNTIRVATRRVYLSQYEMRPDLPLSKLLPNLTPEQTAVFNDERLRILTTARVCSWCAGASVLRQNDINSQRASEAFKQKVDLKLWQYIGLLHWADIYPSSRDTILQRRRSMFESVLRSPDDVMDLKVQAFVYGVHSALLDDKMRALTPLVGKFSETAFLRFTGLGINRRRCGPNWTS
ncbi:MULTISPECIES: hypothetical protein [unclassified Mesorhizobium]|uniref:hypothetical protein n=1 Tax=Mesorhizobium sp. M1252 TaxID=2957073 RepID=UPI0003D03B8A|nr:hypothetical protein [Mesorhizobium sp. L2C054A000]ESZ49118.1 hypothetical protein X731_08950 [Mesorhizobium sp. L2C054A000]